MSTKELSRNVTVTAFDGEEVCVCHGVLGLCGLKNGIMKLNFAVSFGGHATLLICGLLLAAGRLLASDISGDWEFEGKFTGDISYGRISFRVEGDKLSGKMNRLKLEGTMHGEEFSFTTKRPNGETFADYKGTVHGDKLEGTAVWFGWLQVVWTAKRPVTPPASPKVHDFEPKEFHRVFSDAITPVLRIFPGDTVRTWTVDAGGADSKGVRRSLGGNPETGPFYVEGALAGDTLVVKLDRARLNRDSAGSGGEIASSAVTPDYVRDTKYDDKFDSNWVLDRDKGLAHLKQPSEHLTNYTVKLQPMLGCIAVAPPGHQSFRTGFLGTYGGNMDYNQMQEGTTLYLPVYAPGALLFVGDGHAAQGDGELTGDALETSMDVEFTVNVIKGESTRGPRAENSEYLMATGIANSLPEALQSATTELANWLQKDYKLEPNEVAIVLGTAMHYNVAEVVDPLVHVVAKIRKDALAGVK
jgi:amidase